MDPGFTAVSTIHIISNCAACVAHAYEYRTPIDQHTAVQRGPQFYMYIAGASKSNCDSTELNLPDTQPHKYTSPGFCKECS